MPASYPTALVDQRLAELYERHRHLEAGRVARDYEPGRGDYRPDVAGEERDYFGVAFAEHSGEIHVAGGCDMPFALQSLSKGVVYGLALEDNGRENVLEHVGVEPSGDPFYSIEFDDRHHRPHNPMVNAGALVTSALVKGADAEEKLDRVLHTLRLYAGNDDLAVDEDVF